MMEQLAIIYGKRRCCVRKKVQIGRLKKVKIIWKYKGKLSVFPKLWNSKNGKIGLKQEFILETEGEHPKENCVLVG